MLFPVVEFAETPAVTGAGDHFLQLHWKLGQDDLDERRVVARAQLHVDRALLVAQPARADGDQAGRILPERKPPVGTRDDLALHGADGDQRHLRVGNGGTARIDHNAAQLVGRLTR